MIVFDYVLAKQLDFEGSISKGAFRRVRVKELYLLFYSTALEEPFFLPIWQKKTGKSGHVTVLGFLVCAQGCKISDITFFSPVQRQLTCQVRKTLRTKRFPGDFDVL